MPQIVVVANAALLGDRETAKFTFTDGADRKEGFVIARKGKLFAYRNECRHIPMTMDWVENRFLSRDGCFIQCATHGARYEVDTGLCVDGPPAGETLRSLKVSIDGNDAIIEIDD
jgi:nitrite reductase/ring-hydroxylating ferredoxin subunit